MAISHIFISYLLQRDALTPEDRIRLAEIHTETVHFHNGDVIVPRQKMTSKSCLIVAGMVARSHQWNGNPDERVISAVSVPGDFVDLHSFVISGLEHDLVAMGETEVEFVSHDQLTLLTQSNPHLTRLLWMSTTIDAAIHRQWLVVAASRRSNAHLAHLLCELYTRMEAVGHAKDHHFILPLLQRELAHILGYSPIHVNRAVRDLRERHLLRWSGVNIEILDWPGLVLLAGFDPHYLDLTPRPR